MAALAMLTETLIGHAIMWHNGPYWTGWVTDTFLIASVFESGTTWLGTGTVAER